MKRRRRTIAQRLLQVEKGLLQALERLEKLEGGDVASGLIGFHVPTETETCDFDGDRGGKSSEVDEDGANC